MIVSEGADGGAGPGGVPSGRAELHLPSGSTAGAGEAERDQLGGWGERGADGGPALVLSLIPN